MKLEEFKSLIINSIAIGILAFLVFYVLYSAANYGEKRNLERNLEQSNLSLSIEQKKLEIEKIKYELKMYGDIDKDINE